MKFLDFSGFFQNLFCFNTPRGADVAHETCADATWHERPHGSTTRIDETRPRGRRFHTVSCQKYYQTYQFWEINSN